MTTRSSSLHVHRHHQSNQSRHPQGQLLGIMAFMMPVVKNEWDIYKTNRSRRSSECSNPQACRSRKVGTYILTFAFLPLGFYFFSICGGRAHRKAFNNLFLQILITRLTLRSPLSTNNFTYLTQSLGTNFLEPQETLFHQACVRVCLTLKQSSLTQKFFLASVKILRTWL